MYDNIDGNGSPTYVSNAINGLPAVQFNAASNDILALNSPVNSNFTITCVFQSTQGLTTAVNWYGGAGLVQGEVPGVVNDFGLSLNANGQVLAGTGNPDLSTYSGTGYNNGKPHVATFERVQSTGVTTLFVDGVQVGTVTGGTQALTSPFVLGLGADPIEFDDYLTGDIGEVDIYPAVLSTSQRQNVEAKLMTKWGIP